MGIVNLTPDSFSNDGFRSDVDKALEYALKMVNDGAEIIDVGGESSRPGAIPVSPDDELDRVIPFIKELSKLIDKPVSIDTCKSIVAEKAIEAGAQIVNDISALRADNDMVGVVAGNNVPVILMHMKGTVRDMQVNPVYGDVVAEIKSFFRESITMAVSRGIDRNNIILDPGIGFGKTIQHNLEILNRLAEFQELDCPVMIGASRKNFIGKITGNSRENRLSGSLAVAAMSIAQGANIIRVHDVKETVDVAMICNAIKNSSTINMI